MPEDNILQIRNWDRISNSVLHTSSSNYSEKCLLFRLAAYVHLNGAFFMFHHFKLHRLSFDLLLVFPAILLRILIFSDIFPYCSVNALIILFSSHSKKPSCSQ